MEEKDQVKFEIQVMVSDATEEELDRVTRQLLSEVRELNVETAELSKGEVAPIGAKGDPITVGSIVIAVMPAAVPSVIALVQAWVTRGKDRTVKFKGQGIEFEGSPEDLQKLLASIDKKKSKTK